MPKVIKAIYKDGVFKPLEKVELDEGVTLEIEVRESITEKTRGVISGEKMNQIIEEIESGSFL